MAKKVRVLYDFQAEGDTELSVAFNEELLVVDDHTYDGWYMVRNRYGNEGIVPASYVEYTVSESAPLPPPPPPPSITQSASSYSWNSTPQQSYHDNRYNDDDSDFDDEPVTPKNTQTGYMNTSATSPYNDDSDKFNTLQNRSNSIGGVSSLSGATGTIRHKPKNSYGLEAYLYVGPIKPIKDSEKLSTIILDEAGQPQWQRKSPYTIKITDFTSGNKYKGLKTYTAYKIQGSIFSYPVSRRYKQFDWLHERLMDKFPNVCIPPLPDKAVTGRFEEEFIKKRQAQLELWLNRMSLHPVVNQSEVFIHFLQCKETDEKKWKEGKRKHEKDEFRGAQWLCSVNIPQVSQGPSAQVKEKIDKFSKAVVNMDSSLKNLVQAIDKLSQTHSTTYKKELTFVGKKFEEFGTCISNDALADKPRGGNNSSHDKLCEALIHTGITYVNIANSYGEQSKQDASPLLEQLTLYRGILHEMPEVVNFDKNALQIYDELQQKPDKQNYNMGDVMNRLEVVNYATLAEINFFNNQKIHDYNAYMKAFLQKQIEFYSDITDKLKQAYAKFEV